MNLLFRCLCCLSLVSVFAAPAEEDPRPQVLVIADANAEPFGSSPGWPALVGEAKPEWRIAALTHGKQTLDEALKTLSARLENTDPVLVLIWLGTQDASPKGADVDAFAKSYEALLGLISTHPRTQKATVLLCTPVPVVEERLDKWSLERFGNGGALLSLEIAARVKKIGEEKKLDVVDLQQWMLEDAEGGKPGRLLGSLGWLVRDWGHPALARKVTEILEAQNLQARDPEAMARWNKEKASHRELLQLLTESSEGIPGTQEALAEPVAVKGGVEFAVPMEWLNGESLDLLFQSGDKSAAALGHSGNLAQYRMLLKVRGPGLEVVIPLTGGNLRTIAESAPTQRIETNRFQFNAGKMNTFGVTWTEPGARRWVLARFDLAALQGKPVESAILVVPLIGQLKIDPAMDGRDALGGADIGAPRVFRLTEMDRNWRPSSATWKTRDGQQGWTGGTVDVPARRKALETFLRSNPPDGVRKTAEAFL